MVEPLFFKDLALYTMATSEIKSIYYVLLYLGTVNGQPV